jgi:hypothetical protein
MMARVELATLTQLRHACRVVENDMDQHARPSARP